LFFIPPHVSVFPANLIVFYIINVIVLCIQRKM
jgi:hypothetical protein